MNNTDKLEKVKELVQKIAITIGTGPLGRTGTEDDRTQLNIAASFAETFLKEEETEDDDYQSSDAYYDSNC